MFCSGKIYVDLVSSEQRKADAQHVALVARRAAVSLSGGRGPRRCSTRYPKLRDVCWVQEEPENMGAWEFVRPLLEQLIDGRWPLRYIGRVRNSSPSEGSAAWHGANQRAIVAQTFEDEARTTPSKRSPSVSWSKQVRASDACHTNIVVPELGESVVEARVAKWLKKEGDAVSVGDALVELETEKIDLEVSADRAGVLSSIKHGEGST